MTLNTAEKPLALLFHCTGPTNLHKQSLGKIGVKYAIGLCPVFVLKQLVGYNHLTGVV